MPAAFHFRVEGLDDIVKKLTNLQKAMENQDKIKDVIATEMRLATERAFDKKADPNTGEKWKPWSQPYLEYLKLIGKADGSLLKRKGSLRLFDSIMYGGTWIDDEGAHIGSNVEYAAIHPFGGIIKGKRYKVREHKVRAHQRTVKGILQKVREHERSGSARTIPARPYPGLDAQAREDIRQTIRLKKPNIKSAGCLTRRKV